ncbi:hypothetical protein FGB62_15g218 [Gracilaria domingensis]|nr:hypothetical protein FGB62_15g218 [Gracilaria domingensis]
MSVSTVCNSMLDLIPWDVDTSLPERVGRLLYDVLQSVGLQDFSPFCLTEGFESLAKLCPAMPLGQLKRELPLDKGPQKDIPTLVLVGDLDSLTPMEDIVDMDPIFQQYVAVVRGADQVASVHPCGAFLLSKFAVNGFVRNMSACE